MTLRFLFLRLATILAAMLTVSTAVPAAAQNVPDFLSPPADLTQPGHGPAYSLDTLFSALKVAPNDESARAIEDRIWAIWVDSDSDTCNLLMSRVKAAIEGKDYDLAIRLLDSIIAIKPDYVEAWNRRATVYYLKQDFAHAISDIGQVLAREPRHFGALAGLGLMLQDLGDNKDALEAYRKALAIDPHLENVPEAVKTLSVKVDGRDI